MHFARAEICPSFRKPFTIVLLVPFSLHLQEVIKMFETVKYNEVRYHYHS